MNLARAFLDLLFPPQPRALLVRDAHLSDLGTYVAPTIYEDGRIALLPYREPLVSAAITEAKFKGNEEAEALLASLLSEYLNEWIADRTSFEKRSVVLIPIPLSRKRLHERGYNQTERIARTALTTVDGIEIQNLLTRTRHTAPQTTLAKHERLTNMEKAFSAQGVDPMYTYIVFDDVSTTGATLHAAKQALVEAGATDIVLLSLAH